MKFKRPRISIPFVCALLCVLAAVSWMGVLRERSQAELAQIQFESARDTWLLFLDEVGHLTLEQLQSEQASVRELSELEVRLRQYLLMPTKEGQLKAELGRPADLVFRIQSLVDKLGREAQQQHVLLKDSASTFGFGAVLKDAMPPSLQELELVGKECQLMDVLGGHLIAAQPSQIFKVEREGNMSIDFKRSDETFSPQGASINRLKENFSVICFRFSFFGKTQSLRTFLNQVSDSSWPLFITDVTVTPSVPESGTVAQKPVVSGGGSNFQVTVAWLGELS